MYAPLTSDGTYVCVRTMYVLYDLSCGVVFQCLVCAQAQQEQQQSKQQTNRQMALECLAFYTTGYLID